MVLASRPFSSNSTQFPAGSYKSALMQLKETGVTTGYDRTSGRGRQLLIFSPHILRTSCGTHAASNTTYSAATATKNVAGLRSFCACAVDSVTESKELCVACVLPYESGIGTSILKPMNIKISLFGKEVGITRCDRGDEIITAYSGMTATVAAVMMASGCSSVQLLQIAPARLKSIIMMLFYFIECDEHQNDGWWFCSDHTPFLLSR